MKILITSDWYVSGTNGVVVSVKNLLDELVKAGHDVRVLTVSKSRHSYKDGFVYCLGSFPVPVYPEARIVYTLSRKLINELIEWKPDVIHSQCEFCTLPFAKRISKYTGAPIVHTYHTMYEQYVGYIRLSKRFGKKVVRYLTRRLLRNAALIVAPSTKTKKVLTDYGMKMPIQVIPSGISLDRFKQRLSAEERDSMRKKLGIDEACPVLIYLGRLGAEKNVDELLEMFSKYSADKTNAKFLIVGGGPAEEKLKKKASELEITDKVIFTGLVPINEVYKYYQLGDVFVSASTSETQGLTYVEAAASGLPLLCRKDPCLDDIIRQGENGFEYTEEKEFLEWADMMLGNEAWRESAGKISEEVSMSFDKSVFGNAAEEAYESVVKKDA